jgi:hypothetical protein
VFSRLNICSYSKVDPNKLYFKIGQVCDGDIRSKVIEKREEALKWADENPEEIDRLLNLPEPSVEGFNVAVDKLHANSLESSAKFKPSKQEEIKSFMVLRSKFRNLPWALRIFDEAEERYVNEEIDMTILPYLIDYIRSAYAYDIGIRLKDVDISSVPIWAVEIHNENKDEI